MLPHRVNALCDLRIVDQHPREYHVLCNHLVKVAIIQTHIALDDGIHDRSIEHPRRKAVCIMEEAAYDKEIEQQLHLQPVANLGQEQGCSSRLVVEDEVVVTRLCHIKAIDLPAQGECCPARKLKLLQTDIIHVASKTDLKSKRMK